MLTCMEEAFILILLIVFTLLPEEKYSLPSQRCVYYFYTLVHLCVLFIFVRYIENSVMTLHWEKKYHNSANENRLIWNGEKEKQKNIGFCCQCENAPPTPQLP